MEVRILRNKTSPGGWADNPTSKIWISINLWAGGTNTYPWQRFRCALGPRPVCGRIAGAAFPVRLQADG
ncbi:hypothetical protein CHELA20_11432 [Hyphomicrobiales bacterium]|nr:hypothetical protein CHELA20_11432 [Hyphomicrobiales bacterium]CAH1695851.1 hypothetical protein CHELA41_51679 [Hyphomicrobiales bacterium]